MERLDDEALELGIKDCSLNPSLFTHEAHLRLAWVHITKYGTEAAVENITHQLKNYVISLGALQKYNETLTTAAILLVAHCIKEFDGDRFEELLIAFPELTNGFKEEIQSYYSFNVFDDAIARENYIVPDLKSFF